MFTKLNLRSGNFKLPCNILVGAAAMLFTSSVLADVTKCAAPATDCKINVNFTGVFSEETCVVSINNRTSEENVVLPTVSTSKLQNNGDEAGSQSFSVSLKECPINRIVSMHFVSAGVPADTATKNIPNQTGQGFSVGVQVRIRNAAGVQMLLDDVNSVQQYAIPPNGGEVSHYFNAAYYAKGSSGVTAGKVTAQAGIILTYK